MEGHRRARAGTQGSARQRAQAPHPVTHGLPACSLVPFPLPDLPGAPAHRVRRAAWPDAADGVGGLLGACRLPGAGAAAGAQLSWTCRLRGPLCNALGKGAATWGEGREASRGASRGGSPLVAGGAAPTRWIPACRRWRAGAHCVGPLAVSFTAIQATGARRGALRERAAERAAEPCGMPSTGGDTRVNEDTQLS